MGGGSGREGVCEGHVCRRRSAWRRLLYSRWWWCLQQQRNGESGSGHIRYVDWRLLEDHRAVAAKSSKGG